MDSYNALLRSNSPVGGCAPTPPATPQIELLAEVLDCTEKAIHNLRDRLEPVLRPAMPEACSAPIGGVPSISRLAVLVNRAVEIQCCIDALARRVDA